MVFIPKEQHEFTRFLIQKLQGLKPGEVASYADLSAAAGTGIHGGSPYLQSAINILKRDYDMVFGNVRGEGYQRLTDSEIVVTASTTIKKMRRVARRGIETLKCADYDKLTPIEQRKHNAYAGTMGTIEMMTAPKGLKVMEKKFGSVRHEIPIAETLALFGSK